MNSKEEKGFSAVTLSEFRDHYTGKWGDVRPVVIYFAGERFVVEYNEHMNPILAPVIFPPPNLPPRGGPLARFFPNHCKRPWPLVVMWVG